MTPAEGVKALMQNMLGEAEEEEVVVRDTYIHADRYDIVNGCRMATAIDGDVMVYEDVPPAKPLSSDVRLLFPLVRTHRLVAVRVMQCLCRSRVTLTSGWSAGRASN